MSLIAKEPMRDIKWRWDRATVLSWQPKIKATELDDEKVTEAARYIQRYRAVVESCGNDKKRDKDAELLAIRVRARCSTAIKTTACAKQMTPSRPSLHLMPMSISF